MRNAAAARRIAKWSWIVAVWVGSLPLFAMPLAIPNRFEIAQAPGTSEAYTMTLAANPDATEAEEVSLYLSEWTRSPTGEHDWDIPVNGARWVWDRAFAPGDTLEIRYEVTAERNDLVVEGWFATGVPQTYGLTEGAAQLDGSTDAPAASAANVHVTRSIDSGIVTLLVQFRAGAQGLTVKEQYSGGVHLTSLDAAGGVFDTVERSCSSWITLSDTVVQVTPGQSRDVTFTITTPAAYDGTYWSALCVRQASPGTVNGMSATIATVVAVKILVTAPGTEIVSAAVTGVDVLTSAPFTVTAAVENRGNVEMAVAEDVAVIAKTGAVVWTMSVSDVKVLPAATRLVSFADASGTFQLPGGVYQATVEIEYGGENSVVGVRAFRIP